MGWLNVLCHLVAAPRRHSWRFAATMPSGELLLEICALLISDTVSSISLSIIVIQGCYCLRVLHA